LPQRTWSSIAATKIIATKAPRHKEKVKKGHEKAQKAQKKGRIAEVQRGREKI